MSEERSSPAVTASAPPGRRRPGFGPLIRSGEDVLPGFVLDLKGILEG